MSFEGYLSGPELHALTKAMVTSGLARHDAQDAMGGAMLPDYALGLPYSAMPAVRLTTVLSLINKVHNLRNGDVPIAQFLGVAQLLAGETHAATVIDAALDKISYANVAAPGAPGLGPVGAPDAAAAAGAAPNLDVRHEALTGALDRTVSVRFLRDGLRASASVVKLLVHRHVGGHPEYLDGDKARLIPGTGWIIAPDLLITNHHVIEARRQYPVPEEAASDLDFRLQAEHVGILFDYVEGNDPAPVWTGPGALLHADKALDFALLQVPAAAPKRPPLRLRGHAIRKTSVQALGTGVNLLQHPGGNPMRLGFRNNYVVSGDDAWLSYLTDTEPGSSGSPVLDDSWAVAALHAGSRPITDLNIEILGQKYRRENFGIPITTILTHLKQAKPPLYERIITDRAEPA